MCVALHQEHDRASAMVVFGEPHLDEVAHHVARCLGLPLLNGESALPPTYCHRSLVDSRAKVASSSAPHVAFVEASVSGAGQKAIACAKANGYRVSLLTQNPNSYPADMLAQVDAVVASQTTKYLVLLRQCMEIEKSQPLSGVTTSHDLFAPQAAWIAECLGLPTLGSMAALTARNKYWMRLTLQRHCPDLNPAFALAYDLDDALSAASEIGYPLIAKPLNANDSFAVARIRNVGDMRDYFAVAVSWMGKHFHSSKHLVESAVLLEEYISGPEFSVEAYHEEGRTHYLASTCKDVFITNGGSDFTELMLSLPASADIASNLFTALEPAYVGLGFSSGLSHTECRHDPSGRPKIIEINPRLAGDMVGSHAIELATGIDAAALMVGSAVGQAPNLESRVQRGAAVVGVHARSHGIFGGISNFDEISQMPGYIAATIWAKSGDAVRPPMNNTDLLGRIVVAGKDRLEAVARANTIYDNLTVLVKEGGLDEFDCSER